MPDEVAIKRESDEVRCELVDLLQDLLDGVCWEEDGGRERRERGEVDLVALHADVLDYGRGLRYGRWLYSDCVFFSVARSGLSWMEELGEGGADLAEDLERDVVSPRGRTDSNDPCGGQRMLSRLERSVPSLLALRQRTLSLESRMLSSPFDCANRQASRMSESLSPLTRVSMSVSSFRCPRMTTFATPAPVVGSTSINQAAAARALCAIVCPPLPLRVDFLSESSSERTIRGM